MNQEKQQIKEEAANHLKDQLERPIPVLKLTEKELDEFANSLATGIPFSRVFKNEKIKNFSIKLRDKTKRESDLIVRFLDRCLDSKKISNMVEYNNLFHNLSLYYQTEEINGVKQVREYPANPYDDFDILAALEKSPISNWTASQYYIVLGYMFQLNAAILDAAQKVLDVENFT
jgi:hypothetical protein